MHTLENEKLQVRIRPKGAELDSIYHKENKLEYLWSADPVFWGKKSPVLFPIVGQLKSDTYYFDGKPYHLGRHGFAREHDFEMKEANADSVVFSLTSDE